MNIVILESLPRNLKNEIINLHEIAKKMGYGTYITGGIVRDYILGYPMKDIDIVIAGDATRVAKIYSKNNNLEININYDFKTAKIHLKNNFLESIDLSSLRKETYESPGALPSVEQGNLKDDLMRRDFTINTISYSLDTKEILDLFNGLMDIKLKRLRVLHNESFIEDPTRILRAIRFKNRYNFDYENLTKKYMIESIEKNSLNTISKDRLKKEVYICLQEKGILSILLEFCKLKIFKTIFLIENINPEQIEWLRKINEQSNNENNILVILLIIFFNAKKENIQQFCSNFQICQKDRRLLLNNQKIFIDIENKIQRKRNKLTSYDIFQVFTNLSPEQTKFFLIYLPLFKEHFNYYDKNLKNNNIKINGQDLLDLGIEPGPIYKIIFNDLLKNKINSGWISKDEELEYIRKNSHRWR